MEARFFFGDFDDLEKRMNEFFEEVGNITIKSVQLVSTNEKNDAEIPLLVVMLLYEQK